MIWLLILMLLIYGACLLYLVRASRAPDPPRIVTPALPHREAWEVPAEVAVRVRNER